MSEESSNKTCCRGECGKPMTSYVQPIPQWMIDEGREPRTYVTCDTEGCNMKGYTFAELEYPTADLSDYLNPKIYKW